MFNLIVFLHDDGNTDYFSIKIELHRGSALSSYLNDFSLIPLLLLKIRLDVISVLSQLFGLRPSRQTNMEGDVGPVRWSETG